MGFVNAMVSGNKYLVFLRKSYKVVDYSVVRDNEFFVNTKKMDDLMKSLKADAMKKYPKKKIVSVSKKGLIHALKKVLFSTLNDAPFFTLNGAVLA